MKLESYLYNKVKEDALYIAEVATELKMIQMLDTADLLSKENRMDDTYEERQLRYIKNSLSNIYLTLGLHNVKGMCEDIYNSEFKPKEDN